MSDEQLRRAQELYAAKTAALTTEQAVSWKTTAAKNASAKAKRTEHRGRSLPCWRTLCWERRLMNWDELAADPVLGVMFKAQIEARRARAAAAAAAPTSSA